MLTSEKLGQRIKHFRTLKKMTIEELANSTSTDYSFLCKIERGNSNCSIAKLEQLAEVLGASMRQLFDFGEIEEQFNIDYKKEIYNIVQNMNEDELKSLYTICSVMQKSKRK